MTYLGLENTCVNQSVGLIQSVLEKEGIPTVSISLLKEVTKKVKPPRVLFVDKPLGFPLGEPFDSNEQRKVLKAALKLFEIENLPVLRDYQD